MTDKAFMEFVTNTMKNLIKNLLSALTQEERMKALGVLRDAYCMECGSDQGPKCCCTRDD